MKKVYLSFDTEEFDFPRERGEEISLEDGMKVSAAGLSRIMKICKKNNIKATFFCTGNFAKTRPDLIKELIADGYEIACHGVDHFEPKETDVKESKKIVEKVAGIKILGYRQPRMFKVNYEELKKCGYKYDSSVNPAFVPGRYNNLKVPRKPFKKQGILEIPVSVGTARMPMFWLSLHLFPFGVYFGLVKKILKRDGYFTTYFHPWEFADLKKFDIVPWYIKKNSGEKLEKRLDDLILKLKKENCEFVTYSDFIN